MHPSPMAKEHGDRSIGEALVARDRDCDGRQSVAPSRMIDPTAVLGRRPWCFLSPASMAYVSSRPASMAPQ